MDDDDETGIDMVAQTPSQAPIQESAADKGQSEQEQQAWLAEVERVLPSLKIHIRADVKVLIDGLERDMCRIGAGTSKR